MDFFATILAIGAILAVPMGIGLLVTARDDASDNALFCATSWCLGLVGFSAVHAGAATFGAPFQPVMIGLLVAAGAGWLLFFYVGDRKMPSREEGMTLGLLYALALATTYVFRYFVLSKYPFVDIFQEVHTFGSVYLFEDTGQLDLFSTDSYVPLRQSVYVALSIIGISPLQAFWIFPLPVLAVCTMAASGLAASLVQDRHQRFGLAALLLPTVSIVYLTNGSILSVLSIVLLARLLGPVVASPALAGWGQTARAFGLTLVVVAAGAIILRSGQASGLLVAMLAIATLVGLFPRSRRILQPLIVALLVFAGFALHRGSIVFLPCVLVAYACLCAFLAMARANTGSTARRLAGWCMLALAPAGLVLPVLAVLEQLGVLEVTQSLLAGFSAITSALLGYKMSAGSEIMLGTGPVIALIEIARDLGPAAGLSLGGASLLGIWLLVLGPDDDRSSARPLVMASWAWTCGMVLMIVISTGLPFAYRVNGLAIALLTVSACLFLFAMLERGSSVVSGRIVYYFACLSIGLALLFFLVFYQPAGVVPGDSAPYLRLAGPYLLATLAMAALCLGLALWRMPRAAAVALALVGASFALTSDRAGLTARLMTYSYGPAPEDLDAISFYSADELEVFAALKAQYGRWLVLSDPVTVSGARALGGGLAFFNYSNLDTLPEVSETYFRTVLDDLVAPPADEPIDDRIASSCVALAVAASSTPSVDIRQRIFRADEIYSSRALQAVANDDVIGEPVTESDVNAARIASQKILREGRVSARASPDGSQQISLSELNPRLRDYLLPSQPKHWPIILIVTARTLEWIRGHSELTNYFPPVDAIAPSTFLAPLGKQFPLVAQAGDRLFAFNLTCPFAK